MALATRTINGNNSGPLSRVPKIVVMHSTRSGIASKTDAQELISTVNWFTNPAGSSAHWILSKAERVRCVADTLLAWHSGTLNGRAWGIEFTQPTIDRTFGKGHYDNAALIGRHYVKLGVKPTWLDSWDGNLTQSGFVDHEDTVQGRASGKSDMGYRFDRPRFIASLEDDMAKLTQNEFNEMYRVATKTVAFPMRNKDGDETTGNRVLVRHLDDLRVHTVDSGKHSAGGASYTDADAVKAVRDKL